MSNLTQQEQKALGRYWGDADHIELKEGFYGCTIHFCWNDGARIYLDADSRAEAIAKIESYGFVVRH